MGGLFLLYAFAYKVLLQQISICFENYIWSSLLITGYLEVKGLMEFYSTCPLTLIRQHL